MMLDTLDDPIRSEESAKSFVVSLLGTMRAVTQAHPSPTLPTRAPAVAAAICAVILAAAGAAFTVLSTAGNGKLACIGVEVEGAPTMAWLAWLGAVGFARGGYLARDNTLAPPATASVVLVILIAMALFCSVAAAAASGLAGPAVLAAAAAAGWAAPLLVAHLFRRRRLYTAAAGQLLLLEGQAGASTNDMEGFAASTLTGEGLVLAFAASALLFSGMLTYASGATTSSYSLNWT